MSTITRYKRKASLVAIIAIMAVVALGISPIGAFAAGPTIAVSDVNGSVEPGKTFSVTATISDNPGFNMALLDFVYDKNNLELTNVSTDGGTWAGGDISTSQSNPPSTILATYNDLTASYNADGLILTATFKVKPTATAGNYDINLEVKDNVAKNFIDDKHTTINATFSAGTVKVTGTNPGGNNPSAGNNPGGTNAGNGATGTTAGGTAGTTTGGTTTDGGTEGPGGADASIGDDGVPTTPGNAIFDKDGNVVSTQAGIPTALWIVIVCLVVAIVILLAILRKRQKTQNETNN